MKSAVRVILSVVFLVTDFENWLRISCFPNLFTFFAHCKYCDKIFNIPGVTRSFGHCCVRVCHHTSFWNGTNLHQSHTLFLCLNLSTSFVLWEWTLSKFLHQNSIRSRSSPILAICPACHICMAVMFYESCLTLFLTLMAFPYLGNGKGVHSGVPL